MNLKPILKLKADFHPNAEPVRIIALENDPDFNNFKAGDEIGIESIDFSCGNMRVCNKTNPMIFEIYYDKITWELNGNWEIKENKIYKTKIISAFPGIGKTYLYENQHKLGLKILDSDSSTFNKDKFPQNYIEHIKNNIGKVDIILVSSHDVVRNALVNENIFFFLVYPDIKLKDEFIKRYKKRGNHENFIKLLDSNWNNWITEIEKVQACAKIKFKSNKFLFDFIKNQFKNIKK